MNRHHARPYRRDWRYRLAFYRDVTLTFIAVIVILLLIAGSGTT